jgi:hypothetical protein
MEDSGKMTDEQMQFARDWIEQKCNLTNCPLCKSKDLDIEDFLGSLPVYSDSNSRQIVWGADFPICDLNLRKLRKQHFFRRGFYGIAFRR